ncbi:alpha,alpha-trehalase [Pseudoalteromonas sp. NEC-BIFX-2020_002]|uniref:trehalase family glycosidase n=1 Tax=Pseudoalteromonas sp. NEC-BIFX-2020_002 TaxID=2732353 RepID=UPI0014771FFD|nr:trehalase family glycosidase [Pseudoalteromonas sp. NEC-BIFX-2020_002]NNG43232.1 alpha,alpha-trehalase [Pseudoalteromonas sp. NEC-BIFX-2020_002]
MNFVNSQLFLDVQLSGLFADSKTFADAKAKKTWQYACQCYEKLGPLQDKALYAFVIDNFIFESVELPDAKINTASVSDYITDLWPYLSREADKPQSSSLLPLTHSYTVPGGRFQEIYYWDSYFTSLGLEDIGDIASIEAMIFNFIDLQKRNGCIPNGNRAYYSSRSQPPVLALMVDLVWQAKHRDNMNTQWLSQCVVALEQEYAFWMQGSEQLSDKVPAHKRVVRMANDALLNRYWDDEATPRPESLREDLHDASLLPESERADYFRNIRAACESGWDFSRRWLADTNLTSIQTTDIIPVDLNSLLYNLENQLAVYFGELNNSQKQVYFNHKATQRKKAINTYLWDPSHYFFVDYNIRQKQYSPILSLAAVVPLFVKCADEEQAHCVKQILMQDFLKPGGLVTTLCDTSQQWDSPNGWAPLQWFAVQGFKHYDFEKEATSVMHNWLGMIEMRFSADSCLLEKYNVCEPDNRAGGGEYSVQQGFGWTNGVTSRFYRLVFLAGS